MTEGELKNFELRFACFECRKRMLDVEGGQGRRRCCDRSNFHVHMISSPRSWISISIFVVRFSTISRPKPFLSIHGLSIYARR